MNTDTDHTSAIASAVRRSKCSSRGMTQIARAIDTAEKRVHAQHGEHAQRRDVVVVHQAAFIRCAA